MTADPLWLALLIKVAATVAVVVAASQVAQRSGPVLGGVVAALPVSAGPVYVLLALQADDRFIADGAVASVAANAATTVFLIVLVRLIRRHRLWPSLGAALGGWLVTAWLIGLVSWTATAATLINVAGFILAFRLVGWHDAPAAAVARLRSRLDLPLRALLIGCLVAAVVTGSRALGPAATGIAAVLPINLTSLTLVLHPRLGGPGMAATLAGALYAMPGLALALLTLHLLAVPLGAPAALSAALLTSLGWSAGLIAWKGRLVARS